MNLRRILAAVLGPMGYVVWRKSSSKTYAWDGLMTIHDAEFMQEPAFRAAYARGLAAARGHHDPFEWRVHVALWAARTANELPGDFVECGVNQGFISSAIMQHLDWNSVERTFWLLDTFRGPVPELCSEAERRRETGRWSGESNVELARENFAEWRRVEIIEGPVPDTLSRVEPERVAFLHIDMNSARPEVAAAEHFWPRLVPGALVLLDDYAYAGYREQKIAMDGFASSKGVGILTLPTGQGLIVRPGNG